ncbi:MAG: FtsQ-type POTRA domain-containing protein [Myxococcota bacterium]
MGWRGRTTHNTRRRTNRRKRSTKDKAKAWAASVGTIVGRVVPWLISLVLVLSIPAALIFTWEHADKLPIFQVDRVDVEGNAQTSRQAILDAIGYAGPKTNIFKVEPVSAEANLLQLPWIKAAHVERGLPSRLKVQVEERTIGGLVLMDRLYLTDQQGVPFKLLEHEVDLDRAVVTGDFEPGRLTPEDHGRIKVAFGLMEAYREAGLDRYDRLSEVHVDPLLGFALVTERRRCRVLLGEGQMPARLRRLEDVFEVLEQRGIAARTIRLDSERFLDRVAIERASPGKATRTMRQ